MKRYYYLILIPIFILAVSGCKTGEIYSVKQPIESFTPTTLEVETSIINATNKLGWILLKNEDYSYTALYNKQRYFMKVKIKYGINLYTIEYLDSGNLKYDGKTIHKYYNKEVEKLHEAIRYNILETKRGKPPVYKQKVTDIKLKLEELKVLYADDLITEKEYIAKKAYILKGL